MKVLLEVQGRVKKVHS